MRASVWFRDRVEFRALHFPDPPPLPLLTDFQVYMIILNRRAPVAGEHKAAGRARVYQDLPSVVSARTSPSVDDSSCYISLLHLPINPALIDPAAERLCGTIAQFWSLDAGQRAQLLRVLRCQAPSRWGALQSVGPPSGTRLGAGLIRAGVIGRCDRKM